MLSLIKIKSKVENAVAHGQATESTKGLWIEICGHAMD